MKRKYLAIILSVLSVVVFVIGVIQTNKESSKVFDEGAVPNTEYKSELVRVGAKKYGIYSYMNASNNEGNPEYAITISDEKSSVDVGVYIGKTLKEITNPEYKNMFMYPEYEVKSLSNYYGSVYCGIAPTTCKKIIINGNETKMERIKINEQGITADFYLYYLIVEEEEHEKPTLICEDADGSKYQIISEDLAEFSTVKKL